MNENFYEFDDDESGESIIWLAYWCNDGLECIVNVSEFIARSKAELVEKLKTGEEPDRSANREINSLIGGMMMRARFNSQRHYELYTFTSTSGMSKENIEEWFEAAPQEAVNWIRKNGSGILKKAGSTTPLID